MFYTWKYEKPQESEKPTFQVTLDHSLGIYLGVLGTVANVIQHLHLIRSQLKVQVYVLTDPLLIHALGNYTVSLLDSPTQQYLAGRPLCGLDHFDDIWFIEEVVVGPTQGCVRSHVDAVSFTEFHHLPTKVNKFNVMQLFFCVFVIQKFKFIIIITIN